IPLLFLICASIYLIVIVFLKRKGRHIPHALCMLGSGWYMIAVLVLGILGAFFPNVEKEGLVVFITAMLISTSFMIMPKQFVGSVLLISDILVFGILYFDKEVLWDWRVDTFYVWVSIMFFCISDSRYKQLYALAKEKFYLEERIKELNLVSRYDELTGIKNRYALINDVGSYVGKVLLVAMIDMDNFKAVNDTYGHDAGDDILKLFAKLMKNTFGADCCYRVGGDEFLVALAEYSEVIFKRNMLMLNLELKEYAQEKYQLEVGCSIGVACGKVEDFDTFLKMMKEADVKVYEAKAAGKGRIM
ncbi:MAG: GGDEF domain-containing protein, partial [Lachnospiraceae bacterium]|nr:GGDEF domain-containing protein [Lachnospiraceae bacterium]